MIGVVLLLGLTAVSLSAVVVVGGEAIDATQDRVTFDGTELAMTELDSRVALVGLGQAESRRVSLPASQRGTTTVDEDAGELRFTVTNRSTGDTVLDRTVTLGTVRYEQDGRSLAYQGGGVWRVSDGGAARMVSPPEFHYRAGGGGQPTLTLPVVTVSGDATGDSFVVTANGSDPLFPRSDDPALGNPLESGRVEVTVRSDYYRAWGSYLETRTSGTVTYDHDARSVTLTLVSPTEPRRLDDAIASESLNVVLGGGATVDSYNSSEAPYAGDDGTCPAGTDATVYVKEDLEVSGGSVVCGDMYVDGDLAVGGGITVRGDLVVNGDLSFGGGSGTVDADAIVVDGGLDLGGGVTLASDTVVVRDSVSEDGGVTVTSNVNVAVGGEYLSGSGDFEGTARVRGDFVPADGQYVGGTVRTAGEYADDGVWPDDDDATIVEGAVPPDLSRLDRARTIGEPNFEPIDNRIASTLDDVENDSDADDHLDDIESGSCWGETCTLSAGRYYLDRVDVGGNVVVNTTDGPVTLAVRNDFDVGSDGIEVVGDNPVEVYVGGDVRVGGGGDLVTASGRGDQVRIYGGSGSTYSVGSGSRVYGVLYAPGNEEITLGSGAELYGAVVGTVSRVSGDAAIHYDYALADQPAIDGDSDQHPHLTYVHVSVNRVEIDDD
ncbi:hypothetical protein K933_02856 [Candidatus Halobonum tyrrellensis G22]|uniref:DUF7305 domain-containing protein n=1 Tax=Candidatus Halobonum tyrrellensis G22 TaxID=1324957 RepID=V4J2I6_9EURY|nr:hypothetical protein K933_02856 [Candidatus Halobonum tyrrellensis G22]